MTAAQPTSNSSAWPRLGWWLGLTVVMALQLGFIFVLGNRVPTVPRTQSTAPKLELQATAPNELFSLRDPTLFILPHREGFSSHAWLPIPRVLLQPSRTQPDQWLGMNSTKLGDVFEGFMQTNDVVEEHFVMLPAPKLSVPNTPALAPLVTKSSVQVKGELSNRSVSFLPNIPSQSGVDLLANTSVQVLVDAGGNVLSAVLLTPGSGSSEADRRGVELAKVTRFAPASQRTTTVGTLIFEWQTVLATNTPPNR